MAKKQLKRRGKRAVRDATKNVLLLKRMWNGNISRCKTICESGYCNPVRNAANALTVTEEMRPFMMKLGGALKNGSLTTDEFCGRLTFFPAHSAVARLGLATNFQPRKTHPSNILKQLHSDDWLDAAGGPYSCTDLDKVAVCRLMQDFHRSEAAVDNVPRFHDAVFTLEVYHRQMNAYWGMFYCEFYRLVNHVIRESCVLFPASMGYKWSRTEVYNFVYMSDDADVSDRAFLETADAVILMIDGIVCATPCLLDPVGIQHMMPGETQGVEASVEKCLDVICHKNSWLGACCKTSGRETGRQTRKDWQLKKKWKCIRAMVITLKCCLADASFFTLMVANFVHSEMNLPAFYTKETMEECICEDPIMYGYRLRVAELQRNLREGIPVEKGWLPFNFPRFAKNLAARTEVMEQDYLPPYVQLRAALKTLVRHDCDTAGYMDAWYRGFTIRHKHILFNLMERMRAEFTQRPTGLYLGDADADIRCYLELFPIIIRVKACTERLNPVISMFDLHRESTQMERIFAIWVASIICYFTDSCLEASLVKVDHAAKLTAYRKKKKAPPPEAPPAPPPRLPFLRLLPAIRRGAIKSKWTRVVERARARHARAWLRQLAVKLRIRTEARRLYNEEMQARRDRAVAHLVEKLEEMKRRQREKNRISELKAKKLAEQKEAERVAEEKKRLAQEKRKQESEELQQKQFLNNVASELRKRLEYYIIHNIFNDPYLLSFRNPVTGSFPARVFLTFPSLQHLFASVRNQFKLIFDACKMSHQIEALELPCIDSSMIELSVKPRIN